MDWCSEYPKMLILGEHPFWHTISVRFGPNLLETQELLDVQAGPFFQFSWVSLGAVMVASQKSLLGVLFVGPRFTPSMERTCEKQNQVASLSTPEQCKMS